MPTVKDIIISANEITEYNIAPSSVTNTRNDQSSIVKLDDGTLVCGYSRFGDTPLDTAQSEVYISKSTDNGITWALGELLIAQISLGSYIPSFYKKSNGNILVVFFVREVGPADSTIRAIEYDSTMSSIITPLYTILSGDYMPVASDRLFYDEKNDKLLFPYPVFVSGAGSSATAVYVSKMIYSDDEGYTWNDSGILFSGKLNTSGYGGALETGLFQNFEKITMYARNLVGSMYAIDITWNGTTYISSPSYNLGILAQNAMSSIKFDKESNLFIATYIKLKDKANGNREEIVLSTSMDALNWVEILSIERLNGILKTNEPNIFINDEDVIVTYSSQPETSRYDLKCKRLKKSFLSSPIKTLRTFATNPTNERNQISKSEYEVSALDSNTFGNIVETILNVFGDVPNPMNVGSFYGKIDMLRFDGKTVGAKTNIPVLTSHSAQITALNLLIQNIYSYFVAFSDANFPGSKIDRSILFGGKLLATSARITNMYGLHIEGIRAMHYLEGALALGKEVPDTGYKLDVLGKIKSSDIIYSNGGNSGEWNQAFSWGNFRNFGLDQSVVSTAIQGHSIKTFFHIVPSSTDGPVSGQPYMVMQLGRIGTTSAKAKVLINYSTGDFYHQRNDGQPYLRHWTDGDFDIKDYVKVGYTAPASPTATGVKGEIRMTSDYTYTCIATNTWKRTATDATWV